MLSITMRSTGLNAMPCLTSLTVSSTVSISTELPLTSHRRATLWTRNPDVVGLADLFVIRATEPVCVVGRL